MCEITVLVGVLRKTKMKKASSPKSSMLVQIGEVIEAQLCSDDLKNPSKIGLNCNVYDPGLF